MSYIIITHYTHYALKLLFTYIGAACPIGRKAGQGAWEQGREQGSGREQGRARRSRGRGCGTRVRRRTWEQGPGSSKGQGENGTGEQGPEQRAGAGEQGRGAGARRAAVY